MPADVLAPMVVMVVLTVTIGATIVRIQLAELQERVDFAERLLTRQRDRALPADRE